MTFLTVTQFRTSGFHNEVFQSVLWTLSKRSSKVMATFKLWGATHAG